MNSKLTLLSPRISSLNGQLAIMNNLIFLELIASMYLLIQKSIKAEESQNKISTYYLNTQI